MTKTTKVTVTALIAIISAFLAYYTVSHFVNDENLEQNLRETAAQLNQKTPMQLDEETTLDSVAITGKKNLDYYYTLIYKSTEINKDTVEKYVKPMLIERVKASSEMNTLKDQEVIFTYNYYGYDAQPAVSIQVTPKLYQN